MSAAELPERRLLRITGLVQGVGFRPYVFRLATELALGGWVRNDSGGVTVCLDGPPASIEVFLARLAPDAPRLAHIESCRTVSREQLQTWSVRFDIEDSRREGSGALVTPDSYVCGECLQELFDPADRRYRYPFINCTNCGPRFSIVEAVPYDRPATTMRDFAMCAQCRHEYADPADRRFHAQPIACWDCGPRTELWGPSGLPVPAADPVLAAVARLRAGQIIAVKALGGYQLMVDPTCDSAVRRLREHKERSRKPFALLARDVQAVSRFASCSVDERRLLESPGRPIVLLRSRPGNGLTDDIAPGSATLGFMLPSAPLQYLLLGAGMEVLVATSGNAKDTPMAITEDDAVSELGDVVDAFLVHNRRILARVDDSVARVTSGGTAQPTFIRRGRGYSPDVFPAPVALRPTLALGAELKDTICLGKDRTLYLGPHIGDLKSPGNQQFHQQLISHLTGLFDVAPDVVAHDLHPNFYTTALARGLHDVERVAVQHHHSHMASCMIDNGLSGPVIGVVFDGTGYGPDGTIWGGEFLVGDYTGYRRAGHLRTFRLPGGDAAIREPARIALGLLHTQLGVAARHLPLGVLQRYEPFELDVLAKMVERGINSPVTSSMGRLFDAVSSLLGVCAEVDYEGQAAIELEQLIAWDLTPCEPWPVLTFEEDDQLVIDYQPWLAELLEDLLVRKYPIPFISRRFHETIVRAIVEVCDRIRELSGLAEVVLSGGVFLNQQIVIQAEQELAARGFSVYTHHRVPPTDGGISVGQAVIAGSVGS